MWPEYGSAACERADILPIVVAAAPAPRLHPNVAEVYRCKVADFQSALAEPGTQAAAAIRSLIEAPRLAPVEGKREIELSGDLAGIFVLTNDTPRWTGRWL